MVPSQDQCAPQSERTDALLQRSQQPQSRIGHAKSDCPLHQAREASSLSAIHRARHTASLATSGCCVATTKLYPSRNKSSVIGSARLPPCFVIRGTDAPWDVTAIKVPPHCTEPLIY